VEEGEAQRDQIRNAERVLALDVVLPGPDGVVAEAVYLSRGSKAQPSRVEVVAAVRPPQHRLLIRHREAPTSNDEQERPLRH